MPSISGTTYIAPTRMVNQQLLVPVSGVKVTLFNQDTKLGLTVISDSSGNFQFVNVNSGSYVLVETAQISGGIASPGNFSNATTTALPKSTDPLVSNISGVTLPIGTNVIDSLSPNNIFVRIGTNDVSGLLFVDGPIQYVAIGILNNIISGFNLITEADNGTYGNDPIGTPANTSPSTNPYPSSMTGTSFGYQPYTNGTPHDGNLGVVNIETLNSFGAWWNLTDHTTGNESGRFMVINGDYPGALIFSQTLIVKPNTYYVFSTWVANQDKLLSDVPPKFKLNITGISSSGQDIIYTHSSNEIPTSNKIASWIQIGSIFNSKGYTNVKVDFISMGPAANGNDYAIDDIFLSEVTINPNIVQTSKNVENITTGQSGSNIPVNVGDTLKYIVNVKNTSPDYDVVVMNIVDTIPNGTTFIPGSIIGASGEYSAETNAVTIDVGTVPKNSSESISFNIKVNNNTTNINLINSALVKYGVSFDPELGPALTQVNTNTVVNNVEYANVTISKSVQPSNASYGDTVKYTMQLKNTGSVKANNIVLIDTIPNGLKFYPKSVYINGVSQPNIYPNNNVLNIPVTSMSPNSTNSISFSAIVSTTIPQTKNNIATSVYNYTSGNRNITNSNIGQANLNIGNPKTANVFVNKSVNPSEARYGDKVTYTIEVNNPEQILANNTVIIDTIPNGLEFVPQSVVVNSVTIPNISTVNNVLKISLGDIPPTSKIQFGAIVATTITQDILNIATASYSYKNGPYTTNKTTSGEVSLGVEPPASAKINITKNASPTSGRYGDAIKYTVDLDNNGNLIANNVVLVDTIPTGLKFVENSVYINGVNYPNIKPVNNSLNIPLNNILKSSVVTFSTTIDTIVNQSIPNVAEASYNYNSGPFVSPRRYSYGNNTIEVLPPNKAILNMTKTVYPKQVTYGDKIQYTIDINRTDQLCANNSIFIDTIPNGIVINNITAKVDNSTIPVNPPINNVVYINLGTICNSSVININGMVTATLPQTINNIAQVLYNYKLGPGYSNTQSTIANATVEVNKAKDTTVSISKTSSCECAGLCDIINYTITITTSGIFNINNAILYDKLQRELQYIPGTLTINGETFDNQNLEQGINIGTLNANSLTIIKFRTRLIHLGFNTQIQNSAVLKYTDPITTANVEVSSNLDLIGICR